MSPRPSTSVSPRRRPLHERTPSHTNEVSPNRLRGKRREEIDFYSTTPYPTKPAQVLLPRPGIGQDYALHGAYRVSELSLVSTETDHTATGAIDVLVADERRQRRDVSLTNTWEFSSSVDLGHSSQVWDNDPQSSLSSFPTPLLPSDDTNSDHDEDVEVAYEYKTTSRFEAVHDPIGMPQIYDNETSDEADVSGEDEDDVVARDDLEEGEDEDDVIVLPPPPRASIKAVVSASSSPRNELNDEFSSTENFVTYDHTSSPNVVPIGAPSSPNFVSLGSSSPNLVAFGSPSSAIAGTITKRPDSTSSSSNSLGTVIHRYKKNNPTGWPGPAGSSRPASFTSSPPEQLLRGYQSASSLALSGGETNLSRPRTTSTGSGRSVKSGNEYAFALIQYPQIRQPSYASSYAESSTQTGHVKRIARALSERSTTRWNPTLSTVPAQSPVTTTAGEISIDNKQGLGLISTSKSSSTIWPVEENDEHLDSLSKLPRSTLRHIPSSIIGSTESRPGSSSSTNGFLNVLPNWVRLYYQSNNGQLMQNPALSIFESSRPSTAASRPASPHRYISQNPVTGISRPRTRPHDEVILRPAPLRLIKDHPADPRSHWRPTDEQYRNQDEQRPKTSRGSSTRRPVANAWSPHLHPDKGHPNPRYTWTAPSLDSRQEPILGRRNIQKYAFCFGFVFPLAWLIAAFLPLPPQPSLTILDEEQIVVARPGAEYRIEEYEKKRFRNARWWRNVNRVMTPVGVAIIIIVVVLATIGTTIGF